MPVTLVLRHWQERDVKVSCVVEASYALTDTKTPRQCDSEEKAAHHFSLQYSPDSHLITFVILVSNSKTEKACGPKGLSIDPAGAEC
jgi:hypothetical protein